VRPPNSPLDPAHGGAAALGQLLPFLSEEETHLALFYGARRVATDCDDAAPRRERAQLASRPDLATLKRWLRRWVAVRHRDAAERTVLTAIAGGASPAALADLLFAAETDRAYADGGHSLDFINKAFECLDVIGWDHAADVLPSVVGQMAAAQMQDDVAKTPPTMLSTPPISAAFLLMKSTLILRYPSISDHICFLREQCRVA
jgi:hypothetical protein